MLERSILWRRLDRPGHEHAQLHRADDGWRLEGGAVFLADGGAPCRLAYRVDCDPAWTTRRATVEGWIGDRPVRAAVERDAGGGWTLDGAAVPAVAGALDVDLNFSPSTNLLPIRRLALAAGEARDVRAAWLRFPGFELEPLEQRYARLAGRSWRYESAGGAFVRELEVDEHGFVLVYPGFFAAERG